MIFSARMNRREFIVTTTTVAAAAAFPFQLPHSFARERTVLIDGDPYTATVPEGGLGGNDFASSRDCAMRFRVSAEERDRYVLGLPDA